MRRGIRGMLGPVRSRAVQFRWQFNAERGLLDSRQVANYFGVHIKNVQRLVRRGRLSVYRGHGSRAPGCFHITHASGHSATMPAVL